MLHACRTKAKIQCYNEYGSGESGSQPGFRKDMAMEKCSIDLDGLFDSQAAQRLGATLSCVKQGGAAVVDFTRVREFHDVGLAILARTIRESRQSMQLDVRGLRDQQRRLLGYFGVEFAADRPFEDLDHRT